MNKKILLGVGAVLILALIIFLASLIKPASVIEEQAYVPLAETMGTEEPVVEENVIDQPAYLIDAYSKGSKGYIDVDYVEWLHGAASLEAQVEDGQCISTNTQDCYDFPNGYKKNRNLKIRTFEVSPDVYIEISGDIGFYINQIDQTQLENPFGRRMIISFEKLEDTVSKMKSYYEVTPPFKQPKAFITIDVKNSLVTKIVEPYQE